MDKLFVNFLPPWVETNIQPAFYDKESGSVLQQTARMYAKVNCLVRMFNKLSKETKETVDEYIAKFVELKDFVDTYFENLDVQEEINNKLDTMVEDGTLTDIVNSYLETITKVKVHTIAGSSATYIVEFPNGKNMFVDTGTSEQWSDIVLGISKLGITKFDYAVITHFHQDHYGNIGNFISNYDLTDCTWYIQMKPDYENHSAVITDSEASYDAQVAIITNAGFTPIVPVNNEEIIIDEDNDISMRFLNTDSDIAEGYYTRYTEYRDEQGVNFNDFSLICEVRHRKTKFLFTGDIERPVEDAYAEYMTKVNFMTAPHHGVNRDANRAFYYATMPDYAICQFISDSNTWVQSWYKSFGYLKEVGSKLITAESSIPVNGLYSFFSDGDVVTTDTLYSGITDTVYNVATMYESIQSMIQYTSQSPASITLEQLLANLPIGYSVQNYWWASYDTTYAQVFADLQAILPLFNHGYYVDFRHYQASYEIRVYNENQSFTLVTDSTTISWKVKGEGIIGSCANETALIALINDLPIGQYVVNTYTNSTDTVLTTDGTYTLNIDKGSSTTASLTATLRATNINEQGKIPYAYGYFNNSSTPKLLWRSDYKGVTVSATVEAGITVNNQNFTCKNGRVVLNFEFSGTFTSGTTKILTLAYTYKPSLYVQCVGVTNNLDPVMLQVTNGGVLNAVLGNSATKIRGTIVYDL